MRSPSPVRFAALVTVVLVAAACGNSPTDSAGFDILSPSGSNVSVDASDSLRFEVRTSGGFRVEFVVDNVRTVPGPIFFLEPTAPNHTVVARIFPPEANVPPITRVFNVTVTGNLAPVIETFSVTPTSGEAVRDEFVARVQARDPDGSIQSVAFDFGDGSQPDVVTGPSQTFEARHVFAGPGSFAVGVTVTDNGGQVRSETISLQVMPLNRAPTGSLTAVREGGAPPIGVAPLTVVLRPQGSDVDGTVAQWEIDPGDGSGFQQVGAGQTLVHDYAFREELYVPRLRLTDDDGADTTLMGPEITVFRDVSAARATISNVTGNLQFQNSPIAPVVWSTGNDPYSFTVRLRDSSGNTLTDVPIRVISQRPRLVAPDGTVLPVTQFLLNAVGSNAVSSSQQDDEQILGQVRTGSDGRARVLVGTNTSTRLNRIDEPTKSDFESFGLALEANRGHGEWVPIGTVDELNSETTVLFSGGGFTTTRPRANGICPGDLLRIEVFVEQRFDAPGGSIPAANRYTVLRFGNEWIGALPTAEFSDWRTGQDGRIEFTYVPGREDDDRGFRAWVDGLAIEPIGLLALLPPRLCGGI